MFAARPALGDPAAEAARLLGRLALVILMILTPVAELFSQGALYVLLPVGATVLLIAGWLSSGHRDRHLVAPLLTPIGVTALFLVVWAGLSLIWAPFPDEAASRFVRALGSGVVVLLACAFLPERTKPSDLYLLPIGVAATAIATVFFVTFGLQSFVNAPHPDSTLAQRCLITVSLLLWPALGALAFRERWLLAVCLAVVVSVAAFTDFLQIALAAIALGAVIYAIAVTDAVRTAQVLAVLFAALVLLAPIFAVSTLRIADLGQLPHAGPVIAFADVVVAQWPRLLTGHGLGMAGQAVEFGALPADAPHSILFTIWYELGFLGAAAFAVLGVRVFLAAGRTPPHVAPPLVAGLVAGLVIAVWGTETTQLWWMTLNGLDAIAFVLLYKTSHAKRPAAPMLEAEADQGDES
ncbi:MAG: hypothetical protein WA926_06725 [Methylovirgula sp.]